MSERLDPEYQRGEVPPYALCESQHAGGTSLWHLRKIDPSIGLRLGGAIDTGCLCGHVQPNKGWDLNVRLTRHHFEKCVTARCRAAAVAAGVIPSP